MIERVRRWRWPLVIVLFGLCVLLKLNGSSVAFWTKILHEPETQSGLLLFSAKLVRLDEWHSLDALGTFASSTKLAFPDRKSKSRGWSLAIVDERTGRVLHHVLPSAILGLFPFRL